ncbi:MAG: hypothetical protein M1820_008841 [Bogoriella megaspora]|nr:MAG: hypothetical protein M1820_008841 [Bogoriella megaspora]
MRQQPPILAPHHRLSHPPQNDSSQVYNERRLRRSEPFDPNELARRLEHTRLELKTAKSERLKRRSLHISNNDGRELAIPNNAAVRLPVNLERNRHHDASEVPECVRISREVELNEIDETNAKQVEQDQYRENATDTIGLSPTRPKSPFSKPTSTISAFLATTSPRPHHSRPNTIVFDELQSQPKHPNPYLPGQEFHEEVIEDLEEEASDRVEEAPVRPPLGPKDRHDWTQRSECGEDFQNKHTLPRLRTRLPPFPQNPSASPQSPQSAQEILSRRTHSVRIPHGSTRPDLQHKPRSSSHGDAIAKPQRPTNDEGRQNNSSNYSSRRQIRHKSPPRFTDAIAPRENGPSAAERHRVWLEQLREQEKVEAAQREKEQEMLEAKKKMGFRKNLLTRMKSGTLLRV